MAHCLLVVTLPSLLYSCEQNRSPQELPHTVLTDGDVAGSFHVVSAQAFDDVRDASTMSRHSGAETKIVKLSEYKVLKVLLLIISMAASRCYKMNLHFMNF